MMGSQLRKMGFVWVLITTAMMVMSSLAAAETPQPGGVLKIIAKAKPLVFGDPSIIRGSDYTYAFPAIEPLLKIDKNGGILPRLATKWELAADKKSLTLFLREGVKFHDGTDFNAEAVKYNMERRKKGKRGGLERVTSIEVVGTHKVKLNLSRYDSTVLTQLAFSSGQQASPTAIEKNGKDWAKLNPVGTGPFKFVSYKRGALIKYVKNDQYWNKGKPYLDGLEFLIIADPMTASASFQAGEAHVWLHVRPVRLAHELGKKGYTARAVVSGMHVLLGDDTNPASVFANKKVRQAIDHAINKKAITKALGYGFWEAANQLSPAARFAYNPAVKGYPYDPEKAKKLLAEAGYAKGFKTTAIVPTQFVGDPASMEAVKRDLQKVGIDLTLNMVDRGKWYQHKYKGWKDSLMYLFGGVDPMYTESLNRVLYSSATSYPSVTRPDGWDQAIDAALASKDFETRKAKTQEAVKIASDNVMAIPLWFSKSVSVLAKNVHCDLNSIHHVQWSPSEAWLSK